MSIKLKLIALGSFVLLTATTVICIVVGGGSNFTVSFDDGNNITTQIVEEGNKAIKPTDPQKDHYTFDYWSLDGEIYDFDTAVVSDITLVAIYEEMNYVVTFKNDSDTFNTQIISYNDTVKRPSTPIKDGYIFKYWAINDVQFDFDTLITQDLDIEAKWVLTSSVTTFYTATFNTGYSSFDVFVAEGTVISLPEPPKSEDEDFVFWIDEVNIEFDFDVIIASNISLYAKWEDKTYNITFDTDGGSTINPITVKMNQSISDVASVSTTKPNCVFLYWTLDGIEFDLDTLITSDLELKASWSKEFYEITFMSSGSQVSPQSIKYNELITKPADPTHDEATFLYWTHNNEVFYFDTPVTSDMVLVAVFSDVEYEISFDSVGGSDVDSMTILSTQVVVMPNTPTKEGYQFLYWEYNEEQFEFYTTISKNITLKAVWISDEDALYCTVTFTTNGGSIVENQKVIKGSVVVMPDIPTRLNYHFLYWSYNGSMYNFNTKVSEDITLVAVWKIYSFTVTFDSDGGSYAESQEIDMYQRASNVTVTKNNHTFLYWSLDGVEFKFTTTITQDITLVAVWEEIIRYTVSYDTLGGTSVESQIVIKGNKAASPYDPVKLNYTFAYWSYDGNQFDFNTLIDQDITLVAVWVSTQVYVVTFNTDGGSSIDSQLIEGNQTVLYPGVPTKDGYLFMGWMLDGNDFSFGSTITSNITITAAWVLIPVVVYHTVLFVSNSSIVEERTVQSNTATSSLSITQTDTHKLIGWADINGNLFTFTTLITEDITLYASWEERIFYEITYDFDGGTTTGTKFPDNVEKGYATGTISGVTKNLHTFSHWELPNGTKFTFNSSNSSSVTGDIHVKAIWNATALNLSYSDKVVDFTGSNQSLTVPETPPLGVIIVYTNVDTLAVGSTYLNVGVYTLRADAYYDGNIIWSATATLTINSLTLTVNPSGDFEYEYSGEVITPNVTVLGVGYGRYDTTTSSRGTLTITYDREIKEVGIYTATVRLMKTISGVTADSTNYILVNYTFTIEVIAQRAYNFEYEINNNQITITGFFNTIQTELTVPSTIDGKSVVAIADEAFKDMKYLKTVSLPNSITYLGASAFNGCTSLTTVTLGTGITNISDYAFNGCSALTTISFGNNVASIGNYTFYGCIKLSNITQSSNMVSIGNYSFYNNDALTYLPFADSIQSIGAYAFRYSDGLTSIVLPEGLTYIGSYAFANCTKIASISFPSSLRTIETYGFSENTSLTSVVLNEGLTTLGTYAFTKCTYLISVVIPSTLEVLNTHTFATCSRLTSVIFNNNSKLVSIGNSAFNGAAFASITIPNTVTAIGSSVFQNITELTSIVIPDNVTTLGTYMFSGCTSLTSYTLPTGITTIPNYMFQSCVGLTEVVIPSTVTIIGDYAFNGLTNATSVKFNSTNTLLTLGSYAFNSLKQVASINLPISLTTIGSYALANMSALTSITIPGNVKTLSGYAFSGCTSLTSVVVPSNVTSMGYHVFNGCTNLVSATINANITTLPQYTFSSCSSLTTVSLSTTITIIDSYAFRYCTSLTSYTIPSSVYRINSYAFSYCSSLTSVTIHENVTTINSYVFRYCTKVNIFVNLSEKPSSWNSYWATDIGTAGDDTTGNVIFLKA